MFSLLAPLCRHLRDFDSNMKFSFSFLFLGKISDFHKANMSISIKLNMHKNWQVIKANGNGIVVGGSWPKGAAGGASRQRERERGGQRWRRSFRERREREEILWFHFGHNCFETLTISLTLLIVIVVLFQLLLQLLLLMLLLVCYCRVFGNVSLTRFVAIWHRLRLHL